MVRFWYGDVKSSIKLLPEVANYYNTSKEIVIANLYDCRLPRGVTFPNTERVVVFDWEKNAVYYNLTTYRFPSVKEIVFLSSHPCEYNVLFRFSDKTKWILDDSPQNPHHRWFRELRSEYKEIQKGVRNNYITSSGKIILPGLGVMTGEDLNAQFDAYCMAKEL
jgi:hypothetical protein